VSGQIAGLSVPLSSQIANIAATVLRRLDDRVRLDDLRVVTDDIMKAGAQSEL
jgi:hypothetical protein